MIETVPLQTRMLVLLMITGFVKKEGSSDTELLGEPNNNFMHAYNVIEKLVEGHAVQYLLSNTDEGWRILQKECMG